MKTRTKQTLAMITLGICLLVMMAAGGLGCRYHEGTIQSGTVSMVGIDLSQDAANRPRMRLGYVREQFHTIPTGTNITAPSVMSSISVDHARGKFSIDEDFATGPATANFNTNSSVAKAATATRTRTAPGVSGAGKPK